MKYERWFPSEVSKLTSVFYPRTDAFIAVKNISFLFSAYVRDGYKCVAKGKCLDAINDGLNTNERTSNIKTKFYKPNDAYCSQNESEMCCRTTLINETATDKGAEFVVLFSSRSQVVIKKSSNGTLFCSKSGIG